MRIDNSFKIYATVKPRQRSTYDVLYRYSENYEENEISNYKILLNAEKMKVRSLNNMINLYLSPLALSFSGDMVAELILVDLENQQRVTSQEFTFKIESSLTPNQQEEISYTVIEDLGGTYITDSEELKLLAIDGVSGFKLSFTGTEVDKILKDVEGFSHDENNQSLEALKQKGEELQESIGEAKEERKLINSKIKLLENKDALLDVEIEKLKSYDSTNDSNIEEIKSNISELEGYNSTNDEKIQSIDREIKSLKEYNSSNSTKIQSIENEIRSLKKYDETNTSSINKIKEDIVNLKSYNSSNDESIRNINSNIESLKQYNSNNTEVVNGIKSDLQNYKSSNNQAISGVRENLESYKASNNQSVNSINENLESFKNTTNQTVNDINVDISSLKNYNTTNNSRIEEINRSIERNANSISENLQKINSNTSLIEVNKETISSINLKNKEIERDLASSKENIKNNKNDILNLNKKVNKNTEDIKLLKEGSVSGSSSTNSNKEVIDARTATTGEIFDTLDERIDHEVDRLNKKIDVTMLQQEDKESHLVENTVGGMTTDMVIKGRTLHNLFTTSVNNLALSDVSLDGNTFIVNPVNNRYPSMYDKNSKYKENTNYTVILDILENTLQSTSTSMTLIFGNAKTESVLGSTIYRFDVSNGKKGRFIQNVKTIPDFSILTRNLGLKMYMGNNYTGGKLKFNIMVIETSMLSTKQIPSYFSGIKSFGESEQEGDKYKISILSHGKNLVKKNSFTNDEIKKWNGSDENYYVETITGGLKQGTVWGFIESNGDLRYELSFGNNPIDITNHKSISNTREKVLQYTNGSARNTLDKDYKYAVISVRKLSEDTSISKAMISNIETSYEPYKENKKDILIKEPLREDDYLYEDNGQVKVDRESGQYTFISDERITKENTLINITRFYIDTQCKNKVDTRNIICNNFNSSGTWWDRDEIGMYWDTSIQGRLWFHIPKTKFNDVESFRNFLKANPTTIVYQLATSTVEIVENFENINMKIFGERTYVSFENAISGTSSFKAPVDSATTIARLNRENRALEEENKTLRQDFESTTLSLTDSDLELVKQNVDMDFRLMEVEFALDIPQSTLSSNINFKKKGEVKSMARTPYEMMKIVILSGDYDREDYIHKVGKYYERGRMTKEEYDELMSLMTADEVISKKI